MTGKAVKTVMKVLSSNTANQFETVYVVNRKKNTFYP